MNLAVGIKTQMTLTAGLRQNKLNLYLPMRMPRIQMTESISFYIVRPDKLRSRAPAKYEFIKNRIMHGTRYISQIREDLTFEVYNLYPDYVYPGRIIGVRITVTGGPEDDKHIAVELKIHRESEFDGVSGAIFVFVVQKGQRLILEIRLMMGILFGGPQYYLAMRLGGIGSQTQSRYGIKMGMNVIHRKLISDGSSISITPLQIANHRSMFQTRCDFHFLNLKHLKQNLIKL